MKTEITIVFYHDFPHTIGPLKDHIIKIIKEWFNINEIFITHENK